MRQLLVACLLHPLDEAPDVACRQPQQGARFDLRQLLLHRLANHMHPPELLHTHDDLVLSDHPALRLKAGSLSMKRTFLLLVNADIIIVGLQPPTLFDTPKGVCYPPRGLAPILNRPNPHEHQRLP